MTVDGKFIRNCLANNERGDGVLYATFHRGRYIYNKAIGAWMLYDGHHWELDHFNKSVSGVEQVAVAYLNEADKLLELIDKAKAASRDASLAYRAANMALKAAQKKEDAGEMIQAKEAIDQAAKDLAAAQHHLEGLQLEHKAFTRRVERLRSVKGASNCLTWAHCIEESLACKGDEFDRHPMQLSATNGVIDLSTGKIRPGKPTDMIMRSIPVAWPTDYPHLADYLRDKDVPSPCPEWDKFFGDIHLDDAEIIDFHGRYLGYTITGLTNEQYYLCWVGDGANGKGVMGDILAEILGPLSWDISPELILEQKNSRGSSGPSADLISLMGRRMVIASETDENRRISAAMIKRLTGQERITARSPHEKYEITFEPCFKLIFRTNNVPQGLTKDFAMVRRLIYLHYPLMYVDDPGAEAEAKPQQAHLFKQKDETLRERLRKEKPGILLWLVRQCLRYQRDGIKPPEKIRASVSQLRKEEDHLGRFIDEVCVRSEESYQSFREIYACFSKWYEHEVDSKDKYRPSKKSVSAQLVKRGFIRQQTGGQTSFLGLWVNYT